MCDPVSITLGATALSGLGAAGSGNTTRKYTQEVENQNKIAFERSQAFRQAEKERQAQFQTQANQVFTDQLNNTTRAEYDNERNANAKDFTDLLAERRADVNENGLSETASGAVKERTAAIASKEAAKSRQRIAALADLNSYGTTGQTRARGFQDSANALNTLGGFRRGSMGVANQEQQIGTANVTRGDDTFAQLLSGAGMFLGMAGPAIMGGGAGATGAPMTAMGAQAAPAPAGTLYTPMYKGNPFLPATY